MQLALLLCLMIALATARAFTASRTSVRGFSASALKMAGSLHDFKLKDMKGVETDLGKYRGKVVLLENVASL